VQGSTPFGARPESTRVGSVVERAIAKVGGRTREAPVRPAAASAAPAPAAPSAIEPGAPQASPVPDLKQPRIEIDSRRLARAGIFTPESTVNRTMEEFRLIKRIVVERADKARSEGAANANLVMVTSTREGEGKTFVALNLAFSLAADPDRSVMLIDGDPAKSSIAYLLGIEVEHGLTDLLQDGAVALEDVVLPTSVAGLSIVPSGHHHGLAAELFASERMGALLQTLGRVAPQAIVILDAPPVLATSEASALARHVEQAVLVIEADKTSRAAIGEALNLIAMCPHIGLVLNKARFRFGAVRFGAYYKKYYRPGRRRSDSRT
jgi:exopolysaccharide/PEP-CTERM locus tyrosine autokinase